MANDYLKEATWLGDSHPYAHSLITMAQRLDEKDTITWRREYHSILRAIEAMKPVEAKTDTKKVDPLLAPVTGLVTRGA